MDEADGTIVDASAMSREQLLEYVLTLQQTVDDYQTQAIKAEGELLVRSLARPTYSRLTFSFHRPSAPSAALRRRS